MGRAPCCDKANVKKGPWSPEEDAKLKSYIEKHGTGGNWISLPQKIGLKRCGKSCRLRWLNYLRPNIKHGGFTEYEDNLICNLYISIGSRWSIIASQLSGRTDNDIKNYWNTKLKKKFLGNYYKQQLARDNNHCFSQLTPQAAGYQLDEQSSNSIANITAMPQFETSTVLDFQILESEFHYINNEVNDFPGFDGGIPEDIMMPGGVLNSFSAVDLVNSGTVSSASPENVNWVGDIINKSYCSLPFQFSTILN